jgi:anti-anti-sigma factor
VPTFAKALLACESHPVASGYERVSAVGEIDLATGPRLADALRAAQARAPRVVLDLSGATFIDASGVRILLAADLRARTKAGTFAIARPTSPVERVLQLLRADRALAILRPDIGAPEPAAPIRSAVASAVARAAWL